jgi:hypothetical protein
MRLSFKLHLVGVYLNILSWCSWELKRKNSHFLHEFYEAITAQCPGTLFRNPSTVTDDLKT